MAIVQEASKTVSGSVQQAEKPESAALNNFGKKLARQGIDGRAAARDDNSALSPDWKQNVGTIRAKESRFLKKNVYLHIYSSGDIDNFCRPYTMWDTSEVGER